MRVSRVTDRIPYTPPSEVSPGDVVVLGDTVCVAEDRIPAGRLGMLSIVGEYDLPRASVFADWVVGTRVYWDTTNGITTSAGGNTRAGIVSEFSPRTASRVMVLLIA